MIGTLKFTIDSFGRLFAAQNNNYRQYYYKGETEMKFIVFGRIGSDAGYWYLGPDGKWHHVGGWGVEALADVSRAMTVLSESSGFKTPGLANNVTKSVHEFLQKELSAHLGEQLKDGGVVVINALAG